ncbi:MAG: DUF6597 domain-containing transcriptional factor [Bacteroides sp.]
MYKEYLPCDLLSPYIDRYWEYEGQPKYETRISIPPYGCTDFVFTLGEGVHDINNALEMQPYHSYFVGPMNTHTELVTLSNHVHVFGIRFLPGGLYRLMGLPLNELVNHKCHASDLTNLFEGSFIERLYEGWMHNAVAEVVDQFLVVQLKKYDPKTDEKILFAVDQINQCKGVLSMRALASTVCLCQRHLERKFKIYTGYSPKEYGQIIRFWNAIDLLRKMPNDNLLSTAVAAGYYDVPHLSREVKRLSGNTPSAFLMLPSSITTRIYLES